MDFLLSAIKELWTNFYNVIIRDATSTLKGIIILILFLATVLSLVFAMKTRDKADGDLIHNWGFFWISIFFLALLLGYCFMLGS